METPPETPAKGSRDRSRSPLGKGKGKGKGKSRELARLDDEIAAREAAEGAGGAEGQNGQTERHVIIRNPYNNDRRMHIRNQRNVHHLVIQTFKSKGCAFLVNSSDGRRQIFNIDCNYYFDTGEIGMYMTDRLIEEVKRHMYPVQDTVTRAGPNIVKIKRMAGRISQFGLGAPFIAGSADQAATNSMVAQAVQVASNLHEKMLIKKGKTVLNSAAAGIPTVTSFNPANVVLDSSGIVTGFSNVNDWEKIGKFVTAAGVNGQVTKGALYFDWEEEGSDTAFQFYQQTCVTPVPVAANVAIQKETRISLPKKSPFSVEVDMTESQGLIAEWNEDCDWLLSRPDTILDSVAMPGSAFTLAVDHAQTVEIRAGQTSFTPVDDHVIDKNDSEGIGLDFYRAHVGKSGNYIDTAPGKDTINQWQTLPTFAIHPLPPPTKENANAQHVLLPLVVETEIDFEISFDSVYSKPLNQSTDTTRLQTGNPEFVNYFKREQGTNKIHSCQTHAQKWGTNPVYFT